MTKSEKNLTNFSLWHPQPHLDNFTCGQAVRDHGRILKFNGSRGNTPCRHHSGFEVDPRAIFWELDHTLPESSRDDEGPVRRSSLPSHTASINVEQPDIFPRRDIGSAGKTSIHARSAELSLRQLVRRRLGYVFEYDPCVYTSYDQVPRCAEESPAANRFVYWRRSFPALVRLRQSSLHSHGRQGDYALATNRTPCHPTLLNKR